MIDQFPDTMVVDCADADTASRDLTSLAIEVRRRLQVLIEHGGPAWTPLPIRVQILHIGLALTRLECHLALSIVICRGRKAGVTGVVSDHDATVVDLFARVFAATPPAAGRTVRPAGGLPAAPSDPWSTGARDTITQICQAIHDGQPLRYQQQPTAGGAR